LVTGRRRAHGVARYRHKGSCMMAAAPTDIAHWRARIFDRLLMVMLPLALATAVPSMLQMASIGNWPVVAVDALALAWLLAIWRLRRVAYSARVLNFLAMAFLVGVALMLKVGPVAQIYLLAVPVLAALLLGRRTALMLLTLTTLAVLLVGLRGMPADPASAAPISRASHDAIFLQAAIVAINYLFIGAIITLSCAVLLDHLARSLAQLHARNAELRLNAAALAQLNDMVIIAEVDADAAANERIIFVNEAFERRTGWTSAAALGHSLRLLGGPATDAAALARVAAAMARGEPLRSELLNYASDGSAFWVESELVPLADAGGRTTHWVAVERDISERKRSEGDIHRLAFFDVLTGLPNRRLLMDRIDTLLAGAARGDTFSAVVFVDLDRFKQINDARGHATGDALLRGMAMRLAQLTRKADTVARLGADEFVLLLAHLGRDQGAATLAALGVAEKVRTALAAPYLIAGEQYVCSASVGITLMPKSGAPGQGGLDFLREADIAVHRAKAEGRSGVAFFEPAMQADVERTLTLERDLASALAAGGLEMHVQLQVDGGARAVGAELLMRWPRADGTMVPPAVFIPVAEECGLMVPLGHWALDQACAMALTLARAGHPLPLSVNVSPAQFREADFVARVRRTLADSGAPATMLILEVTEGLLVDDLDATIARMCELAALGLRFSIDDFGTGYSSLAYLRRMPLYELKIDRSFIHDTPADAGAVTLVQTILGMARNLGLRVVAEGVETQAQADFLVASGCDCMQGYLFARPQPLEGVLAQLDRMAPPALPPA
jgi:diguanylate cyclase (GGDEF)-like protein/PAS domain S-box-containing protein